MKERILELLGDNHTTPCVFNNELPVEAIYTWENDVFCLNMGEDFPFDELSQREKEKIECAIEHKEYVEDESFQ